MRLLFFNLNRINSYSFLITLRVKLLFMCINKGLSLLILAILTLTSCEQSQKEGKLAGNQMFELLTEKKTGISFVNEIKDQEDFNILTFRNYYNGGGVSIGDVNNDGLNDIYFSSNMGQNKLYLNRGNLSFEDVTEKAGVSGSKYWSTGVTMSDVNADGNLDIYVCNSGDLKGKDRDNELFINNGDGTFTERAREYGLNDSGFSTHASFFDYDLDGDLDCFVLNNSYTDPQRIAGISRDRNHFGAPGGDRLYRNDNNKFTDITPTSGIYSGDIGFGLGVSVGDVDGDRYPDIYVSNDFWERDYLYINNQNGTFTEKLTDSFSYVAANSMGSDIADLNNDGCNDIFTTDMLPSSNYRMKSALMIEEYYLEDMKLRNSYFYQYIQNALQINNGDGTFKETGFYSGVAATDWSWGALIFDMDNDGNKDIFVSNGIFHDITDLDFVDFISSKDEVRKVVEKTGRSDWRDFLEYLPHNKQQNFAFINKGNLKFENQAQVLGLHDESYSNGSAYGDLDNDGDYDLVINNVNMNAFVYENKGLGNNYLKIKLKGSTKNPKAIGTQVKVFSKGQVQTMESYTSRGFESSVDPDLIFGLGSAKTIDSLVVIWPDLETKVIKGSDVSVNSTFVISYDSTSTRRFNKTPSAAPEFISNTDKIFSSIPTHVENEYLDYDHERLLPHASSTEGPRIVQGDVNGDKKDDFILLGSAGQADQLFLNKGGVFKKSEQKSFDADKELESVCGVLFDADQDSDLDLVIGNGGNEYQKGMSNFLSRFYLNDGKGNFRKLTDEGPLFGGQVGCIKANDFDRDGDIDLFVGGANVPANYGLVPRSFLLRNDGKNKWTDITTQDTGPIGMVKDAVWADVNDDKLDDLIVVGEWMPITVFLQENKNLKKGYTIANSNGWWNTIEKADLDKDGDDDFVLGNWGENMKLPASHERPLKLYVNDFDSNGRNETILEWQFGSDDKPFPFASKKDLTSQLPILKKKSLKYQEYARKQVKDIFPNDILSKSLVLTAYDMKSSLLLRNGKELQLKALPFEAQMSPVFAVQILDVDQDNIDDVILGGNFYKLKPEIGRLDGFNGGYFKGKGDGTFIFVSAFRSGLKLSGQVRDITILDDNLMFSRNNQSVMSFKRIKK
jgi:enediyne biosynthesis protein E4